MTNTSNNPQTSSLDECPHEPEAIRVTMGWAHGHCKFCNDIIILTDEGHWIPFGKRLLDYE